MTVFGCAVPSFHYARARCGTLPLAAFFLACAGASFAAAPVVDVSSATRLERVMASIRARDPREAAPLAESFASEPRPEIRAWVLRGAVRLDPRAGAILAKTALSDPDPVVRLSAVQALGETVGAAAVPALGAALVSETAVGVRQAIVFWLGGSSSGDAVAVVAKALASDPDPNVRAEAAQALDLLGRSVRGSARSSARQALKKARQDPDERVRRLAHD